MFKKIKKIMMWIGIMIGAFMIVVALFMNLSPQFGGEITEEHQKEFLKSKNYKEGKFVNKGKIELKMSFGDVMKAMKGFFQSSPNTRPSKNIEVIKIDSLELTQYKDQPKVIWFGHSAFLLQLNQKNILIDPMFGEVPAPHPMLGAKRFNKELPIEIEKLPMIDFVLISHDHYDHLDYESILKLKEKVGMFYVPLGLGAHLIEWGVKSEQIVELDWWQEVVTDDLTFTCTPAQHFSGRGFSDREKTLWSSWVILSEKKKIFFSGDSGYGTHFKEIGEKYGPFDLAMLECGQYNKLWPTIHMMPEQTAQAGLDVRAKLVLPIHWGTFKLSQHTWTDPIERLSVASSLLNVNLVTPEIGQTIVLEEETRTFKWWKQYLDATE